MLKRLSALLLCASQVFLLPLINQPAIAWLRSGVGPTMSDPIDLDFDKAITKMHTLRPVDKPACAYVSALVLKDIKDEFYISGTSSNAPTGTWQIVFGSQSAIPLHMGYYYSDGGRYEGAGREPSFSAQIVSGTNPMWISPLSTDEIKACLQLLERLGPDSSLSTDGVTVHFSRSLMDPDRLHTYVNIDFYRKGFLRANYTTEIPAATEVPTTEESSTTDNKKSGIADQRATKPPSGAGHITFVTAETQKQHIAKFHTLLPQVLQAASAKRLTPSQAREQLYALYIEESQSFKWNLLLQNRDYRAQVDQVDPSIYPGMVEALKKLYPIVMVDLKPSVHLTSSDRSLMMNLPGVYSGHRLLGEWASMEEWSIQCAMAQTDQLPSTYDNYLYNVMQYYIARARTAGDKALYRRACLFVLAAIQHVKTEDDKNAVGPKLQALAKICTDQLESLN